MTITVILVCRNIKSHILNFDHSTTLLPNRLEIDILGLCWESDIKMEPASSVSNVA
jgi:hypothetical protein